MDSKGERTAYQYSGINGRRLCHKNIVTKLRKVSSIHIQVDTTTALSYLVKMGGTRSKTLTKISKEIWQYLLQEKITLTAEWIPSKENFQADWEFRNVKDPSEWILKPVVFQRICKMMKVTPNRSFCFKGSPPVEAIHEQEAGPKFNSGGCSTTKLENIPSIHFSSHSALFKKF